MMMTTMMIMIDDKDDDDDNESNICDVWPLAWHLLIDMSPNWRTNNYHYDDDYDDGEDDEDEDNDEVDEYFKDYNVAGDHGDDDHADE